MVIDLEVLKSAITKAGGTVLDNACFENDTQIYASSVETVKGCYGHPLFEAQYFKDGDFLVLSFANQRKEFKAATL